MGNLENFMTGGEKCSKLVCLSNQNVRHVFIYLVWLFIKVVIPWREEQVHVVV